MRRMEQLADELRAIIGTQLVRRVELPDGVLASVTRVEVARTKRHAIAWLSVVPDSARDMALKAVNAELYDIQGAVNGSVASHPAPRIAFKLDEGLAHAARIGDVSVTLKNTDDNAS